MNVLDSYYDLLNRLTKDSCLIGLTLNRTATLRSFPNELSVYASVKTLANFVLDCPRILGYIPYMKWAPNPFGAVVVFPGLNVLKKTLGFTEITPMLSLLIRPPSWKLENDRIITAGIKYDSLLRYCSVQELQLSEDLMKLYSNLTLEELNVLATNRTEEHTVACVNYNLQMWRNNFEKFIDGLGNYIKTKESGTLNDAIGCLRVAAKAAKLIPTKIKNFQTINPSVRQKISRLSGETPIGQDVSKSILGNQSNRLISLGTKGSSAIVVCNIGLLSLSKMDMTKDFRKSKRMTIEDYFNHLLQFANLSEGDLRRHFYIRAIEEKNLSVIWECLNYYFTILRNRLAQNQ